MSEGVRIVQMDASNVEREGFFCYKSKPKTPGYRRKLEWLKQRFAEGMTMDILYDGKRSCGFLEAIPGEYAWRAVDAPGYTVIHCIWTVGSGKNKVFATRLLERCLHDGQEQDRAGVVMVASDRPFLADRRFFLKRGFSEVDSTATFELMARKLKDAPDPSFPTDWESRINAFGPGLTVIRTDQCPYWDDATTLTLDTARKHGIGAQVVELRTALDVQRRSSSPYGTFGIVKDGRLLSHYYLLPKELELLLREGE